MISKFLDMAFPKAYQKTSMIYTIIKIIDTTSRRDISKQSSYQIRVSHHLHSNILQNIIIQIQIIKNLHNRLM